MLYLKVCSMSVSMTTFFTGRSSIGVFMKDIGLRNSQYIHGVKTLDYLLWCTSTYLNRINDLYGNSVSLCGGQTRLRMLTCEGWLDRGAWIGGVIG